MVVEAQHARALSRNLFLEMTVKISVVKLHRCIRKRRSYVDGAQSRGRKEREQNIDLFSHVCEKKENDHSILQPKTKLIPDAVISAGLFTTSLIFYGILLGKCYVLSAHVHLATNISQIPI